MADLVVTGTVEGFVTISPAAVILVGPLGDELKREVRITPTEGHPFTIKEVKAKTGRNIKWDVKPLGKTPAKDGYLLTVTSTKQDAGSFGDYIEIQTDLKEKPMIGIPVNGRLYQVSSDRDKKSVQ